MRLNGISSLHYFAIHYNERELYTEDFSGEWSNEPWIILYTSSEKCTKMMPNNVKQNMRNE